MNFTNKKSRGTRGIPQSLKQRTGTPQPFKPVVTQAKHAVSAFNVKQPVAPPVYRPQTKHVVAQAKMAGPVKNHPVAPPVYRPQPVPKVLQRKISSGQSPRTGQVPRTPAAPPIYRPDFRAKPLQRPTVKTALPARSFKHGVPVVQAKQAISLGPRVQLPIAQTPRAGRVTPSPNVGLPRSAVVQRASRPKRKREERKENPEAQQLLVYAFHADPDWAEYEEAEAKDDGPKDEGECYACISFKTGKKGKGQKEGLCEGSYSDKTGYHAEMVALASFLALELDLENIIEIRISSPPCTRCKTILNVLGISDKVKVPPGKGRSHGSCKAFKVPPSVLNKVAETLSTTSKSVDNYLQTAH